MHEFSFHAHKEAGFTLFISCQCTYIGTAWTWIFVVDECPVADLVGERVVGVKVGVVHGVVDVNCRKRNLSALSLVC